jgi:demethylmenaquinone methyltransferase/2-methoxy-6-polyprenyl-1,4-benzoquinol methylase
VLLHFYLKEIVPLIGGLVSGCKPAYRYLGISAVNFPSAEEVKEILERIGFQEVSFKYLSFGIVAIHICRK